MSSTQTKGEFLLDKFKNMAKWVTQEVGQENLPVDLLAGLETRSVLEITVLCGALGANNSVAIHRNWSGLVQLMAVHKAPSELQEVVVAIQKRPELHDKFWRYIELFMEVAKQ